MNRDFEGIKQRGNALTEQLVSIASKIAPIEHQEQLIKLVEHVSAIETHAGYLHKKLASVEDTLKNYDKLHKHELRELWLTLHDKYAMAAITGLSSMPAVACRDCLLRHLESEPNDVVDAAFSVASQALKRREQLKSERSIEDEQPTEDGNSGLSV